MRELAYGRSPGTLWVHLYGGSTLDTSLPETGRIQLTQTTSYPWEGRVSMRLEATPAAEWGLHLRVPAWTAGATLAVNGKACIAQPAAGAYVEIRRVWAAGDTVELTLPLKTRLLQSHPLVEETRSHVAVRRGPVVYCLESVDLPSGTTVRSVSVPREVELKLEAAPAARGPVMALSGEFSASDGPDWGKELYRDLPSARARTVSARLIPYFTWGNRGSSEMSVWLPLKP